MRLSIEDEPDINEKYKVLVFLDGMATRHCIEADEEAGYVVRFKTDGTGRIQFADDDNLARERVDGKVQIVLTPFGGDNGYDTPLTGAFVDVRAFQKKFNLPWRGDPGWPEPDAIDLRVALLNEEFDELMHAITARDIIETADALADLIYVAVGAAWQFGINLPAVWDEVHQSNMRKEGGPMRPDGKILKPKGWLAPDIKRALRTPFVP